MVGLLVVGQPYGTFSCYRTFVLTLADAIEVVRPSIVQVLIEADNLSPVAVGTGFIAHDSGLVLTARHVTQTATAAGAQSTLIHPRILIGLGQPNTENMRGNFVLIAGQLLEEDRRHDLALIRMRPNPLTMDMSALAGINFSNTPSPHGVASLFEERPRDGEAVAVSGYPLSETLLITTSGALATAWGIDIQDMAVSGPSGVAIVPDIKDSYLADVSVNPGNSGGPVYRLSDGAVLGVCVAFRSVPMTAGAAPALINGQPLAYNSGLSVVVPIKYGVELISRHSV